jgi:hypothetical protein
MEQTQAIGEGLTFEKVWAAMQESNRRMEAMSERVWEQIRATEREMEENNREFNRRFGEFTNRFGEVVEYMVVPTLITKFRELNFEFTKAHRDTQIVDRKNDIITEVDAFLENGDKVMIVEIKSKPDIRDVDYHVERMEKLRRYADLRNDKRAYLGAVAGVVMSEPVRVYALKNGFYLVEPSGDTFTITEPQGKYHPREW